MSLGFHTSNAPPQKKRPATYYPNASTSTAATAAIKPKSVTVTLGSTPVTPVVVVKMTWTLVSLNFVAAIAHATGGILALVLGGSHFVVPTYSDRYSLSVSSEAWSVTQEVPEEIYSANLSVAISLFFWISFVAHVLRIFPATRAMYFNNIADCRAPLRWVEYFFSAPIMAGVIAYLVGVTDLSILFLVASLVASTMLFGAVTEMVVRPSASGDTWNLALRPRLIPHLLGYIPLTCAWIVIIAQFAYTASLTTGDDDAQMPGFVYAVVSSQVVLFWSFGFVQLFVLLGSPSNYIYGEVSYLILSLLAKAALGALVLGGLFGMSTESGSGR